MNSLELSCLSDEELKEISNNLDVNSTTFGVIGVCGIVGNLVARILMDKGFKVIGTDMALKEDCRFKSSFDDYDIKIFYGGHPEGFFKDLDYVVVPPSLPKKAKVFDIIREKNIQILELGDIFKLFKADKSVICISGTNGKTTTTTFLKHIAYACGIRPSEHNLEGMQGNNEFIPSLQARLNGDLAILETGTDGTPGGLESIVTLSDASFGLLCNITPDHLDNKTFIDYAKVKGELVKGLDSNNGTLIINSDDPTLKGLVKEIGFNGKVISFGLEADKFKKGTKPCWCGKDIEVNEIITGSGTYNCDCGIKYEKPDYLAKNISIKDKTFTLETPEGDFEFKLAIDGLHNVYNATGTIVAAHEFLNLPFEDIQKVTSTFNGAAGRMEIMGQTSGKTVMVDYGHNPAGIETILNEINKLYDTVSIVITVTSESGFSGDLDILNAVLSTDVDYIIPASLSSKKAATEILDMSKNQKINYDYGKLNEIFVFTEESADDIDVEKLGPNATLGTNKEGLMKGFKTALKTDVDLILCVGEAAFKFDKYLKDFCDNN